MKSSLCIALLLSATAFAAPRFVSRASFTLQNGEAAIALNNKFKTLAANSSCTAGENACVNNEFAQCVNGAFVLQTCGGNLICAALPLVNSQGTSIACTTQQDVDARIAATGATSAGNSTAAASSVVASSTAPAVASATSTSGTGSNDGNDCSGSGSAVVSSAFAVSSSVSAVASSVSVAVPTASAIVTPTNGTAGNSTSSSNSTGDAQSSLTLLQSVIATGFEQNGQQVPTAGQVASLTSSNNFINFCATVNLPITNGQQIKTGSCNPAPMGMIASTNNMPSAKFVFPENMGTVKANTNFTVTMAISNLETGHFVNADSNYFAAPQVTNGAGNVQGHSHLVIERLSSLNQTTPTNPNQFAFFKGLNDAAQNGTLTAVVTGGLPAGAYRMASINSAANHQPVLVAIAQHGALDDMIYFTVQ